MMISSTTCKLSPSRLLASAAVATTTTLTNTKHSIGKQCNEKQYDASQVAQFDDACILVDNNDQVTGRVTKKDCHLLENINKGMLHRAFSVFLFDSNKRLLLQQRSMRKITFPDHWTNTVCSHPLYSKEEMDESNEHIGIKRAAKRRLFFELGIDPSKVDDSSIELITRVHYRAENSPSDGVFGEHEIDYVVFVRGDFELKPNPNEVKATRYLNEFELREWIHQETRPNSTIQLTPWFGLIAEKFLFNWWKSLDNLNAIKDHKTIHRFVTF